MTIDSGAEVAASCDVTPQAQKMKCSFFREYDQVGVHKTRRGAGRRNRPFAVADEIP